MPRIAHYASTHADYDGCTMDLEACGRFCSVEEEYKDNDRYKNEDWKTHDRAKVTCPKCLDILSKTDFKTVTNIFFDSSTAVLYNNAAKRTVQIGELDIEPIVKEELKKRGFKVEVE